MAARLTPDDGGDDDDTVTNEWRWRVQNFLPQLTGNARPFTIICRMKPPLNIHDPDVREIITLDNEEQCVKATEKLLDYLVSDENLDPKETAERWRAFDQALSEVHPLLYDIVHGRLDPTEQELQKAAIQACMEDIIKTLDPKHLSAYLVSKDLLSDMDRETLDCKGEQKGRTQSAFYMLSHLHRSANRNWYQDFLDMLSKSGYEELVDMLQDKYAEIARNSATKPVPFASSVPQADAVNVTWVRPLPAQHEGALCEEFQRQSSMQTPSETNHMRKMHCPQCKGSYNEGARHRCIAGASSSTALLQRNGGDAQLTLQPWSRPAESHVALPLRRQDSASSIGSSISTQQTSGSVKPRLASTPGRRDSLSSNSSSVSGSSVGTPGRRDSMNSSISSVSSQQPAASGVRPSRPQGQAAAGQPVATAGRQDSMSTISDTSSTASAKPPKKQCPTCGKMFERLGAHKCKVAAQPATTQRNVQTTTATTEPTSGGFEPTTTTPPAATPLKKCPTCGKTFVRLGAHKCTVAAQPATTQGNVPISAASQPTKQPATSAANAKLLKECPICGRMFERLGAHKCKGKGK